MAVRGHAARADEAAHLAQLLSDLRLESHFMPLNEGGQLGVALPGG